MKRKVEREDVTRLIDADAPPDLRLFCQLVAKDIIAKQKLKKEIDTNGKVHTTHQVHCKGDC